MGNFLVAFFNMSFLTVTLTPGNIVFHLITFSNLASLVLVKLGGHTAALHHGSPAGIGALADLTQPLFSASLELWFLIIQTKWI